VCVCVCVCVCVLCVCACARVGLCAQVYASTSEPAPPVPGGCLSFCIYKPVTLSVVCQDVLVVRNVYGPKSALPRVPGA
jgi:hypothetical protein